MEEGRATPLVSLLPGRLLAQPRGALDEDSMAELRAALAGAQAALSPTCTCLIDLRGVHRFELSVGKLLLEVHRAFFSCRRRTVYLAERAHVRGLTNWVIHEAQDPNARTVMSDSEAAAWLSGTQARIADAKGRALAALDEIRAAQAGRRKP